MRKFKIIYIIGAGRSGTTLLDIILGNEDSFFSSGELNRYLKREGIPHCARDKHVSLFWEEVASNNVMDFKILKPIAVLKFLC